MALESHSFMTMIMILCSDARMTVQRGDHGRLSTSGCIIYLLLCPKPGTPDGNDARSIYTWTGAAPGFLVFLGFTIFFWYFPTVSDKQWIDDDDDSSGRQINDFIRPQLLHQSIFVFI